MLLLLAGCLDQLLESPYILTTGLGEARSVSPGPNGQLLVAASKGVYQVDGSGASTRISEAADALTVHPRRVYLRRGGVIAWDDTSVDAPGALDIQAGYDVLAVLYADRLVLDGRFGALGAPLPDRTIALDRTDARTVALGPSGYLVVTESALLAVDPGVKVLVDGLVDARAAVTDAKGRVYVVQGSPSELWRVDDGKLVSIARWLGDPRDLHFGLGGVFPAENLYIATGMGTLEYVRPP
jgi:hypothetical protein